MESGVAKNSKIALDRQHKIYYNESVLLTQSHRKHPDGNPDTSRHQIGAGTPTDLVRLAIACFHYNTYYYSIVKPFSSMFAASGLKGLPLYQHDVPIELTLTRYKAH